MKLYVYVVFLELFLLSSRCDAEDLDSLTDDEYDLMPPIFEMDDFYKCRSKNDLYCKLYVQLKPLDETTAVWKAIKKTIYDSRYYDHDKVKRTICFSREFHNKEELLQENASAILKNALKASKLIPVIKDIKCKSSYENTDNQQIVNITWIILAWYIVWISYATFYDFYKEMKNRRNKGNYEGNKYIAAFSMMKNWEHFIQRNRGENYTKLKSMQGLRTITMMMVIVSHTVISILSEYVENTKFIEEVYHYDLTKAVVNTILFLVQTDFLISAWLLAIHVHDTVEQHGSLSLKHCFIQFLSRVFRLLPCVALMVLLHRSSYLNLFDGPISEFREMDRKGCTSNWMLTLLFANNYQFLCNMCNMTTWYLSTDTQLYIVSLIIFYLLYRYRISTEAIFLVFLVSLILHSAIIYLYNLDIIFRNFRNLPIEVSLCNSSVTLHYAGVHCNIATYMMGLCFGTIYSKYKHISIRSKKILTHLWLVLFLLVPLFAVWISIHTFNRTNSALVGAFIRPLYAFGIGIGILGMSFNIGGVVKRFLESRAWELLANLTFSTYIFHVAMVFGKTSLASSLHSVSIWMLLKASIQDITLSFTIGLVMYFLVEQPGISIRNIVLPQVPKNNSPCQNKDL